MFHRRWRPYLVKARKKSKKSIRCITQRLREAKRKCTNQMFLAEPSPALAHKRHHAEKCPSGNSLQNVQHRVVAEGIRYRPIFPNLLPSGACLRPELRQPPPLLLRPRRAHFPSTTAESLTQKAAASQSSKCHHHRHEPTIPTPPQKLPQKVKIRIPPKTHHNLKKTMLDFSSVNVSAIPFIPMPPATTPTPQKPSPTNTNTAKPFLPT